MSLKPGTAPSKEIAKEVSAAVVSEIGPIARPHEVIIVPDMPKTRSGKIMRRVLAATSNHREPGDISTLADPEIVERIRQALR
jgi:acetyl-CoA synthetase